mgnify:CR=1 FL=1
MLIRNILEESVRKFDEVKAVKWLKKKEIMERSYGELMENVVSTRKGLLAEGFEGKHIALIGTSSVEWMESYLGIITGCTTAVPLDAALPCEDLIDLLNRSDSVALFLSPKLKPYLDAFLENCPKLQKVWMLQGRGRRCTGQKYMVLVNFEMQERAHQQILSARMQRILRPSFSLPEQQERARVLC